MSSMPVKGKRFVCSECRKMVQIEYEGGVKMTQVGDMEVYRQMQLSEYFGTQSEPYLYDIGLCSQCYERSPYKKDEERIIEIIELIDRLYAERKRSLEEISALVEPKAIASVWEVESIKNILGERLETIFGDKHMAKSKRKRQVEDLLRRKRSDIANALIADAFRDGRVAEIVADYEVRIEENLRELERLLKEGEIVIKVKRTDEPENLNSYIVTQDTIRYPVEGSAKEYFFFEVELDSSQIFEDLKMNEESFSMEYTIDLKGIDEIIIGKLQL